jgi:hypothetical protein
VLGGPSCCLFVLASVLSLGCSGAVVSTPSGSSAGSSAGTAGGSGTTTGAYSSGTGQVSGSNSGTASSGSDASGSSSGSSSGTTSPTGCAEGAACTGAGSCIASQGPAAGCAVLTVVCECYPPTGTRTCNPLCSVDGGGPDSGVVDASPIDAAAGDAGPPDCSQLAVPLVCQICSDGGDGCPHYVVIDGMCVLETCEETAPAQDL